MIENLIIENSIETFESWITKDFLSDKTKKSLQRASILFVPSIGFREENVPTFPVLTEEIYNYFQENLPAEIIAEICIDDENYFEIALHSDYKRIGNFVVKAVVIPIFAAVLTAYIIEKYVKPEESQPQINVINIDNSTHTTIINPEPIKQAPKKYLEPSMVQFTITVVDSSKNSKEFKYEGKAKDVKTVVDEIYKLWGNDTTTNSK